MPGILVPEGVLTHGRQLFDQVARLGLEGIMAKRLDGPYLPGKRSGYWLKIKPCRLRAQEPRWSFGPWHNPLGLERCGLD
jgi:bifunctional non-homologous end joining protein LigD